MYVGETDVRNLDPELLRSQVGVVPQRPYLFSGTIATNLRYGNPDASDEELWRCLEIAQAADFVRAMPDGLDTPVAQGGTTVSGGQRQRLAIARALVKRPKVYLFDDSFSALDLATDARLRAALEPVTVDACVIIVAQRVSTIREAERIVVLEDGAIVGVGRHQELLAECPTYARDRRLPARGRRRPMTRPGMPAPNAPGSKPKSFKPSTAAAAAPARARTAVGVPDHRARGDQRRVQRARPAAAR